MRVAMEAASLGLSSGGLARYTSELSLALARCFPQDEFVLVSDQPFSMPPGDPANLKRGGGPRTAAERRWWLWGLGREARRLQADLVHGPDFAVPYLPRLPSVLTLHDLSPWMDSGWHHAAQKSISTTLPRRSAEEISRPCKSCTEKSGKCESISPAAITVSFG